MKSLALVFVMLCATVALAAPSDWQDAKVTRIDSSIEDEGAVVGAVGTTIIGGRIKTSATYYWIETKDIIYVLAVTFTPMRSRLAQPNHGHPLNVTLNGMTKIALEGTNAHILDDSGKDVKVPIVEKIARTPAPDPGK